MWLSGLAQLNGAGNSGLRNGLQNSDPSRAFPWGQRWSRTTCPVFLCLPSVVFLSLDFGPCSWLDVSAPFSFESAKDLTSLTSAHCEVLFMSWRLKNDSVHHVEGTSQSTSTGRACSEACDSLGGEWGGFLGLGYNKQHCLCCFHFPRPLFVQALKQVDLFWI